MKILTLLILLTTLINIGCSQTSTDTKFIDSFPKVNTSSLLPFGTVVGIGPKMTQEEALAYVYANDTTKLTCKQKIFNMETENVEGISTELYLPQKCLQIEMSKFVVIGFSSFECQDPSKPLKQFLTLNIIRTLTSKVTDSLVVYSGNDYGAEINGLINPKNNKIFILKQIGALTPNKEAIIYKINDALKFEIEKHQIDVENMTDNLEKDLKVIGWNQAFLN